MTILAAIALVLLLPDPALAWGPGVHMALGNSILAQLPLLAPLVAQVLTRHPESFLYGSLSADIFIGKGLRARPGHSHDWVVGRELARATGDGAIAAYGYGYLAHLAADVVAHNYYVPNQLAVAPMRGKMSHVFVEVQADARVDWDRAQAVRLFSQRWTRAADLALLKSLNKGLRPFLVKKRIFKESVSIAGRRQWGRFARGAGRVLPLPENERHLSRMLDTSLALVMDLLAHPNNAVAYEFDPIGAANQAAIRTMGRRPGRRKRGAADPDAPGRARIRHARLGTSPPFPIAPAILALPVAHQVGLLAGATRGG